MSYLKSLFKFKYYSVFQKTRNKCINIFDIPYYKLLEKYMKFLGQDPRQRDGFRNIIVIVMVASISGILIPTVRNVMLNILEIFLR